MQRFWNGTDTKQSAASGDETEDPGSDPGTAGSGADDLSVGTGTCDADRRLPERDPGNSGRIPCLTGVDNRELSEICPVYKKVFFG